MKLIKTLHELKSQYFTKQFLYELSQDALTPWILLSCISILIWYGAPYITFDRFSFLAQPDKRIYIILALFLLWILKYLLFDLDIPDPLQFKDPQVQKKCQALYKRFHAALMFLKKTNITKRGQSIPLAHLPWYLLIGPSQSGKTAFLANSNVNFILQKQFHQHLSTIETLESVDWWITRDACIIDIPGKFISNSETTVIRNKKQNLYLIVWQFFLKLTKKFLGKNSIAGILLALPLPEMLKESDSKKYQTMLLHLFERIIELQKVFNYRIPCHIVITKCDLLTGFDEYFADASDEEIMQSWGISLSELSAGEKIQDVFMRRFNALIKRLNQQLLWRLHQERNPMARPFIKDFPLQVERLKDCLYDLIKKFTSIHQNIILQGVYLTSALQINEEADNIVLDDAINNSRSIQIFQPPRATSRAYFIKNFVNTYTAGIRINPDLRAPVKTTWLTKIAYGCSAIIIATALLVLGRDFQLGLQKTYIIQDQIAAYEVSLQQFHDPIETLAKTSQLLDTLWQASNAIKPTLSWEYIKSFYSNQSEKKASLLYQQTLHTIFASQVRDYLGDYLKNAVNQNTENVYTVLKTYLMLGGYVNFEPHYVLQTLKQVLPQQIFDSTNNHLMDHLTNALAAWQIIPLNESVIYQTRRYLTSLPSLRLSYIILKNFDNNNLNEPVDFSFKNNLDVFANDELKIEIPSMYTVKTFNSVFSEQIVQAAKEAMIGNVVLGDVPAANNSADAINELAQQLRIAYVNNYVDLWERILTKVSLSDTKTIAELDNRITAIISNHSPLIALLQMFHTNTYFEPIASSSNKLQAVGMLIEKYNQPSNLLYEIVAGLNGLHQYLQMVMSSNDPRKMAFNLMSKRIKNLGSSDVITQLRFIAAKSPEPIKTWLEKISNDAWHHLMQEAGRYLDTSWKNEVVHVFQTEIANRYPFNYSANDLELNKFINFFGNPGVIISFYNNYLQNLIDTSKPEWRWKIIDNNKLPFSDDTLRQIQHAILIHKTFFPNDDNKPYVQFALQPYQFDKQIKTVKLNINEKLIVDQRGKKNSHVLAWPGLRNGLTSLQFVLNNRKLIKKDFPGDWGWFRFLNQAFESSLSKKETLISLSSSTPLVKYILFTGGQYNPFYALNLQHFKFESQISEQIES